MHVPRPQASDPRAGWIGIAGVASIGAGVIHAAAVGVHTEHSQAVWAFTLVALFQIAVGVLALVRPGRVVAVMLGAGSALLIGGWLLAKTMGIGFVDGLGGSEPVQFADASAAALAGVAVAGVLAWALRVGGGARALGAAVGAGGVAVALLAVPALASIDNHSHDDGHAVASGDHDHIDAEIDAAATFPQPFDPSEPIDLSGMDGVTPEQQARAEALLERTIERLPQFADVDTLHEKGFFSIGDAVTGDEHYINWSNVNNDRILDPDYPESLVFREINGRKTLVAAMYMLPEGTTLDDVPDLGGPLTQWHVHNDLCFTPDPVAPTLAFSSSLVVGADEECAPPNSKRANVPMIHVWIVPHPCGPFAALEGIGGGQIAEGEERLCDHVHGSGG